MFGYFPNSFFEIMQIFNVHFSNTEMPTETMQKSVVYTQIIKAIL